MKINQIRTSFPGLDRCLYFNTASYAIGNTVATGAFKEISDIWLGGDFNFRHYEIEADWCRAFVAHIINASPDEVALCCFLSIASNIVASQLPETKSANIVVSDIEFSSNYFPWLLLRDKGYTLRIVPTDNGRILYSEFLGAIDKATSLVAVSAVQSATGFHADLALISEQCKRNEALLFVDASQALGVVPLDVKAYDIDFLASVSYKFMLGSRGMCYLYIKSDHISDMKPLVAGWRAAELPFESFYGPSMKLSSSAERMDSSQPWFPVHAERKTFEFLEDIGMDYILDRNRQLRSYFYGQIEDSKLKVLPLEQPARSNNIIFDLPESLDIQKLLDVNKIRASIRNGRLRISFHFYNTKSEIDQLCRILKNAS